MQRLNTTHLILLLVEVNSARPVFVDLPEQLAQLNKCNPLFDSAPVHFNCLVKPVDPLENDVWPVEWTYLLLTSEEHGDADVLHRYFIYVAFHEPVQRANEFVDERELFGFDRVELLDECHVIEFVGDGAVFVDARHKPYLDVFDEQARYFLIPYNCKFFVFFINNIHFVFFSRFLFYRHIFTMI